MRIALLLAALLCVTPLLATADDAAKPDALTQSLTAFFAEEDEGKRAGLGMGLAMRHPDAAAVAKAIPGARTWPADAKKGDVIRWKRTTANGKEHAIFAAIPEAYDPKKAWPVLIWLHGGVNMPRENGGVSGISGLGRYVDEGGFIVLSPSTQQGSEWWVHEGVGLVRGSLDDLKKRYHVDANRVAVAGFSDGGSGCLHLLAHDPEPYACFMPLMGNPVVTRIMGGPSFAANVRSRPVFAISGGQDQLYPSAQMKPYFDHLKAAGCDLEWTDLPLAGHNPAQVFPEHWERLRTFFMTHPRDALPKTIAWETALPDREGRFAWIEVLAVDPKAPSAKDAKHAVLPEPPPRPVLGIRIVREFAGPGLMIEEVTEGSAAEDAGMEVGDVILAVEGEVLKDARQAMGVLQKSLPAMAKAKKAGTFTIKRGDEELFVDCLPRPAPRSKELGYGLPSGRIEARVEANTIHVTTRHVAAFRLHLADGLVDLAKPVKVMVNGTVKHDGVVKSTTGYVLQEAVRGGPGAPLYRASIVLKP